MGSHTLFTVKLWYGSLVSWLVEFNNSVLLMVVEVVTVEVVTVVDVVTVAVVLVRVVCVLVDVVVVQPFERA